MGIMDEQLVLCEEMSVAGVDTTTTDSTDHIHIPQVNSHLGVASNDRPFVNQNLCLNCVATADFLAAVDGCEVIFDLYADSDGTTITTDGDKILSKTIIANDPADQVDGDLLFSIPLPVELIKPYLQVEVTIDVQNLTTGSVTMWIGPPTQQGGEHGAL